MNKIKFCLVLCASVMLTLNGLTQQIPAEQKPIPEQYEKQFQQDSEQYLAYTSPSDDAAGDVFNLFLAVVNGQLRSYKKDSLKAVYDSLEHISWHRKLEFIQQHPSSYASLYYFNLFFITSHKFRADSLHSIYISLDKEIKATPLGQSVAASIQRKQSLQLNLEMPDFSFRTTNARTLNLSDFRGRTNVLICFWASWCRPCVRNIPALKQIEEAYRSKGLQVISISIDRDSTKWFAALEKHKMPWLQTRDLLAYTDSSLATLYEVQFIPQYFLVDKRGILIYQNVLNDETNDLAVLKEVLKRAITDGFTQRPRS